jgi:tetratricopeptide (TPR) repeat protein
MSHSNLGTYDLSHGQVGAAIQHYEAAIQLTSDPGLLAQTYANLGAAYRATGQVSQAQEDYNKALRLNANQFNAWLGLGLIAQKQGNMDEAIRDLSRSVELQPSGRALLALGKAFEQSGRFTEALSAYDHAKEISPGLSEAQQAADLLRYKASHPTVAH